jgi:hypothetical protein
MDELFPKSCPRQEEFPGLKNGPGHSNKIMLLFLYSVHPKCSIARKTLSCARRQGKNGYCTHIGNELFAWFQSTKSKSRINFIELLRVEHKDYVLGSDALEYMRRNKLPKVATGRTWRPQAAML